MFFPSDRRSVRSGGATLIISQFFCSRFAAFIAPQSPERHSSGIPLILDLILDLTSEDIADHLP
jgi:hypothetical protein